MRATGNLVRQVEAVFLDGMLGLWSDDRLLDRFACEAGERAERAFTAIVERHGPRVYRVCRGVAGDGPTAEDAFQATFLVLARKAGTLRVRESLGPWLHGVAARLAATARANETRRRRHEAAVAHRGEPSTTDPERDPDLHRILHAEISRLPFAYREAVYLCDVEGLSQETVALRLSCAIGTVRSRLSRGRKRLRSRLIRRGIVPAAIAALTSRASAALPVRLADAAARNAVAITSSGASCGVVPAAAVALFEEGMTTMLKFKIRALIGAAIVGLSATAAVVFAQDGRPGARSAPEDPTRKPSADARPAAVPLPPKNDEAHDSSYRSTVDIPHPPRENPTDPTDPFQPQHPTPDTLAAPSERPIEKDVMDAFLKQRYPDLKVRIEKLTETVEPAKNYPLAGSCQLVHAHYKGTLTYKAEIPGTSHEESVFLNRDYLRRVPNAVATERVERPSRAVLDRDNPDDVPPSVRESRDADAIGIVGTRRDFDRSGGINRRPSDVLPDRQRETDRRLDDVERKLDRILKALEKAPAEPRVPDAKVQHGR